MATLTNIKRRIKTAKNVSKSTKAMQMIAASKLKRAQEGAISSKPYVEELSNLSKTLYRKVDKDNISDYMKLNDNVSSKLIIVISPDKGLCGGLVTNLVKEIINFDNKGKNFYITVGKKAEAYITAFGKNIIASFPFGTTLPSFDSVYPIIQIVDDYFLNKKVSEVVIITTHFVSIFTQIPNISLLLPVRLSEEKEIIKDMVFDANVEEILPDLLKHYIEMMLYQSFLESYASEQSARMIAMKNATDNAIDMIFDLNLQYNKTRQEKITSELLDIMGGAYTYE